jgi:hypothetical protein
MLRGIGQEYKDEGGKHRMYVCSMGLIATTPT